MLPDNRVNSFHEGQVWESPRGTLYKVMFTRNSQTTLRAGDDGTGKITRRPWDAVVNWILMFDPLYPDRNQAEI